MTKLKQTKGEATRRHILHSALKLFRKRGFDRTTMRDIAQAAGLSLGAAYHYFPSKEALLEAYYEWMQTEHERLAQSAAPPDADLRVRISTVLQTKLNLLRRDRKLLASLFRNLGDPSYPLSIFSRKTAKIRERSIAQFVAVFDEPRVPDKLRTLLGRGLWLGHLALFLFFVHDKSPGQARTRRLADTLVDLVAMGVPLLTHPFGAPIRNRLLRLMGELDPERGVKP